MRIPAMTPPTSPPIVPSPPFLTAAPVCSEGAPFFEFEAPGDWTGLPTTVNSVMVLCEPSGNVDVLTICEVMKVDDCPCVVAPFWVEVGLLDAAVDLGNSVEGVVVALGLFVVVVLLGALFARWISFVATAGFFRWTASMAVRSSWKTPCLNLVGS